jgi:hypothetical protein
MIKKGIVMKNTGLSVLALACAIMFCGCTVTQRVVSYGAFDNAVKSVAEAMEKEGFTPVDGQHDQKKGPSLSTRSYDIDNVPSIQSAGEVVPTGGLTHGFQGSQSSDYTYTDTYRFANDRGEEVSYSVSYRTGVDIQKHMVFVREAYVSGCETSNPAHHDRLCGEHSPIHRLDSLEKDTTAVL